MMGNASSSNTSKELNDVTTSINFGLVALVPDWCRSVLMYYIALMFMIGLPANALIIFVHFKTKRKTVTEWFVAFIAISDLLSLTICLPIYIMIMKTWWPSLGSSFGCKFHHFNVYLNYMTSIIIIACIAVERLWKSKTVEQLLSTKTAVYCGLVAFGYSAIFGIILTFGSGNNNVGECMFDTSKRTYLIICACSGIVTTTLSCGIIIYCYVRIVIILRNKTRIHSVHAGISRAGRFITTLSMKGRYGMAIRTTKLMFLVTMVFIITTIIPLIAAIGLILTDFRDNSSGRISMFFLTRLYIINNCANPYFYLILNKNIRSRVNAIFKKQ